MVLKKRNRFWIQIPKPKMVSLSGPKNQNPGAQKPGPCGVAKVHGCAARVLRGKQPLCRHLDEISVSVFQVRWEGKHRLKEAKGASF